MTRFVLDTNVFSHKKFCEWLKTNKCDAYLSTVAYTELLYHYSKRVGKIDTFVDDFLDVLKVKVLPFDKECAHIATKAAIGHWDFKTNVRDYMIGSLSVTLKCPLITKNIKDFEWLEEQVLTPEDFLRKGMGD